MFASIVIPVYNESSCLEANLRAVDAFFARLFNGRYEVVCVDDGSEDDSLNLLNKAQSGMPLRVCAHPHNRGKGAAIRTGMLEARGEVMFFFDADLSTPLKEIERFLPHFDDGAEVVLGTRKSREAHIRKFQPPHRVIMGMGYTYLVNWILGMAVSDYTCGFKAFSRSAVDLIFPRTKIEGWSFDVEILYLAHRFELKTVEVPVTWENRPGTKVRLVRDTLRSFQEILKVRSMHRNAIKPERERSK
jgi:dolichyl-phosphate beta-glucosyltransferase